MYVPLESSSNNKVEKYKTHAFNKDNTVMTVATMFFCCSYCSLGQVEYYSSKSSLTWWKQTPFACETPSSSQNKRTLCNPSRLEAPTAPYRPKRSLQSLCQGHHLVWNHVPYNKTFVSRGYTKVCGSCRRSCSRVRFAWKAKITPRNSNTDNC